MRPIKFLHITLFLTLLGLASAAATNAGHVILESNDDSDVMIFFPLQVEEGPDGNLYVLDSGDSYIKVFSPTGQYLHKIGGQGEGPGEFQRTDGATFGFTTHDKLFFTEYIGGHHWLTITALNGDLAEVISPQLDILFGIEAAFSLDDGGFLVQFAYNAVPRAEGDYFLYNTPKSLARIDSLGVIISEIANTDYTRLISYVPGGATTNLPFTPAFAWISTASNEVIWSDGMSPKLQVLDFSGQRIREFETPLPQPKPVSKSDLQLWKSDTKELINSRDPVWWGRFGRVIEKYKKPLYDKPILQTISTTPGGNLLVEGQAHSGSGEFIYWLLSRQGIELGNVTVAASKVHFSEHYLLFVTYDEEENPQIHAVEHYGDEVAAMAKLRSIENTR